MIVDSGKNLGLISPAVTTSQLKPSHHKYFRILIDVDQTDAVKKKKKLYQHLYFYRKLCSFKVDNFYSFY